MGNESNDTRTKEPIDFEILIEGLIENKSLDTIDLTGNHLKRKLSTSLKDYLSSTSTLKKLIYQDKEYTRTIREYDCGNFHEYKAEDQSFDRSVDESFKILMEGLRSNKSLITLKLGGHFLFDSPDCFDYLGEYLISCSTLLNLSISWDRNNDQEFYWKDFCSGLATCKNIQELEFLNCTMFDHNSNSKFFSEALKSLCNLTKLNLSGCTLKHCRPSEIKDIFEALSHCENFSVLNLKENNLGFKEDNFSAFLPALDKIKSLTEIDLSKNYFRKYTDTLNDLFEILNNKKFLIKLNLGMV